MSGLGHQTGLLVFLVGLLQVILGLQTVDEELPPLVTESTEKLLIRDLLTRYEDFGKQGRPVYNYHDTLRVNFSLSLIQILDVDEKNQVLKLNIWYHYIWTDLLLTWDPTLHDNITSVRVPSDKIWLPDIYLYNFADDRLREQREALVVVQHNGELLWMPQAILNSSCSFDTLLFPFDSQKCSLKFGSWTYHGQKVDLDFVDGQSAMDVSDFMPSNEWDLIDNYGERNVKFYTCCPEPYPDLLFTLKIRRKVAFYTFILILPCALLSLLTLVIFWVPPESPAKLQLGMNIFLAFFVLLLLLADYTPRAAASIPLIGAYFCLSMVMITLSTVLACVIANMFFRGVRINRAPRWLRSFIIDGVARLMNVRHTFQESPRDCTTPKKTWSSFVDNQTDQSDPELAFARVNLLDTGGDSRSDIYGGDGSSLGASPARQMARQPCPILEQVSGIREHMDKSRDDKKTKDTTDSNVREWRVIACVVDRLFFVFYVIVNGIGLIAIILRGVFV
ncbi:neuronal acetylcholine receptor subunit alpha-2-like [Haliotis asinina]|uniref:neuronal acetylcholine receptor subunit alpha-2-like n=1 Tax=Haliotis asinina TaxID=109174 RepID=UPI00353228FB